MSWYKFEKTPRPSVMTLDADGKNKQDFFVPDIIGDKRFALNYGGYPRSDIAIINEQQNFALAKAMFEQLADYGSNSSDSGVSDAELLLGLRSKYCQSASEQIRYFENEISRRDSLRAANLPLDGSSQKISFTEGDEGVVIDEPKNV